VFWRENGRDITRGRKTFVKIGMSFAVRGFALKGVGMSGPVVVPPEATSKCKEIVK